MKPLTNVSLSAATYKGDTCAIFCEGLSFEHEYAAESVDEEALSSTRFRKTTPVNARLCQFGNVT